MGPEDLSHDEFERLARIAHRYYVDGRTQEEIAREFGLSRPTVQRLLERARWSGVVAIHVQAPPWLNLDLEARCATRSASPTRSSPSGGRIPSRSGRSWPGAPPSTSSGACTTAP